MTKSKSPELMSVHITINGDLYGLAEVRPQHDHGEVGIILMAQLLGLFLIFLGENELCV
jgi:hypothetical protein